LREKALRSVIKQQHRRRETEALVTPVVTPDDGLPYETVDRLVGVILK
jgi:hypothetical protein